MGEGSQVDRSLDPLKVDYSLYVSEVQQVEEVRVISKVLRMFTQ